MRTTICATGDLMLIEPFPKEYIVKHIADCISCADARITNLESVFSDWDCFASTFCGGQWINADPFILDEIKKYSFNLYSCANNHSMDFSFNGLLSTMRQLKERDMPYAGIGENLSEASKSTVLTIPHSKKKVALISVTSTFIDAARAGNGNDYIPGRPGVNPLRVKTIYSISHDNINYLRNIASITFINGERDNARKIGSLPPEESDIFNFGGLFFKQSDKAGKMTYCNAADLERITTEIRKSAEYADYVIISIHAHQIKRNSYTEPDYFMEEFAHACIDAGAAAVIGGGTHQIQPIEIYKGKPIFYSLGNFVFQLHKLRKLPQDFIDKYNFPEDYTIEQALNKKGRNGLENDSHNYLTFIPFIEFEDETLTEIKLKPISLNFNDDVLKGLPREIQKEEVEEFTQYINSLCKDYGNQFVYKCGYFYANI
jgi:poly-gamma-glutamate synthesis protein (capsule biosynthesis protein)